MELMQWLTLIIFAVTILAVVTNVIDSTAAGLIGVVVMVWVGVMTETDAFTLVDWNVMAILVGIWMIAGYFGKSGVPSWLSVQALRLSGGRPGLLVMILSMLAGVILMVTFIITLGFMYWYGFRKAGKRISASEAGIEAKIPDPLFATIAVGAFLLTVVGMSFREVLNVKLGFIAMTGAILLVLIVEVLGERLKAPKFEEIIQD